jgi:hypothetical protein
LEKDHTDPDEYIRNKAKQLREAKSLGVGRDGSTNFDFFDDESHNMLEGSSLVPHNNEEIKVQ